MEFRLLGGIEARAHDEPVALGPARQQTVLAALLMDVNRTVATEQLVYRVWGEDPSRRAKDTLYSYLSRLPPGSTRPGTPSAGSGRRLSWTAWMSGCGSVNTPRC